MLKIVAAERLRGEERFVKKKIFEDGERKSGVWRSNDFWQTTASTVVAPN